MRHFNAAGTRRTDDPEMLYHKRLDADMSPQLITDVKSKMLENPMNNQFNMSGFEFQIFIEKCTSFFLQKNQKKILKKKIKRSFFFRLAHSVCTTLRQNYYRYDQNSFCI